MGWDLFICKFSQAYEAMAAIPDKERCHPLDIRDEVRKTITAAFPRTDWSDARWGVCDAGSGVIEFSLGDDEPVEGILVHIRSGRSVLPSIVQICQQRGWQILDISSGLFIDQSPEIEGPGVERWLAYGQQIPDRGHA